MLDKKRDHLNSACGGEGKQLLAKRSFFILPSWQGLGCDRPRTTVHGGEAQHERARAKSRAHPTLIHAHRRETTTTSPHHIKEEHSQCETTGPYQSGVVLLLVVQRRGRGPSAASVGSSSLSSADPSTEFSSITEE